MACGLLLSACGYHLRGSGPALAAQLPPVYLTGQAGPLQSALRKALKAGGTDLVTGPELAQWVLTVLGEQSGRRSLSVGSSGKVAEYEVRYAARYQLDDARGQPLLAPETIESTRVLRFDETQVLVADQEQKILVEDMRRDAVGRILRRLQAVGGQRVE